MRQKPATILEGDTSAGSNGAQPGELEDAIKRTIAREVRPDAARLLNQRLHEALGRWIRNVEREKPIEVFTLNYDTLVERGLEREWVPSFDGFIGAFDPFFSPGSLGRRDMVPGQRWVRLWKLHGSVTWALAGEGDTRRIVRGPESETGEPILPSLRKYRIGQVGAYVRIPVGYTQLYGVCTQVGADPLANDEETAPSILERPTEIRMSGYRWMKIALFGESAEGRFERGVGQYPTVGDEVHVVTRTDLDVIYTDRGDPQDAITIGRIAGSDGIPASLRVTALVTRHASVVGSTGAGKSNLVAILLRALGTGLTPPRGSWLSTHMANTDRPSPIAPR